MPEIVLRSLSKIYPGGVLAVDDLSLSVPDGAFMCLLGASGCGKTTTLRMIAGLEQPTAGEIEVGGRVLDSVARGQYVPAEQRGMGLVFQSYALWPHLTVRQNVEFGLTLRKMPRGERRARVDQVLGLLHIAEVAERYPAQLSGGQQQRVALARMLAVSPQVLLLDEPLSNLDARLRLEMRAELKRIHQELGTTIVFVTHDQLEAMTLGTLVAVMDAGRVQQIGAPMDIYRRPANRFVAEFVGSPPINVVDLGRDDQLGASLAAYVGERWPALAGRVASVAFRPEALRFGPPNGRAAWTAQAELEAVLPTGATWIVSARILGQPLFGLTFAEPAVAERQETVCWVASSDLHLFSADGTRVESTAEQAGLAAPVHA
jgi:iron(III) transport system ATP-binding protein